MWHLNHHAVCLVQSCKDTSHQVLLLMAASIVVMWHTLSLKNISRFCYLLTRYITETQYHVQWHTEVSAGLLTTDGGTVCGSLSAVLCSSVTLPPVTPPPLTLPPPTLSDLRKLARHWAGDDGTSLAWVLTGATGEAGSTDDGTVSAAETYKHTCFSPLTLLSN